MQRAALLLCWAVSVALAASAAHHPIRHSHSVDHQTHIPSIRPASAIRHDNIRADVPTDCALKELALEYAQQLQGSFQPAVSSLVFDALELGTECGMVPPVKEEAKEYSLHFPSQLKRRTNAKPVERPVEDVISLWVDGTNGTREQHDTYCWAE